MILKLKRMEGVRCRVSRVEMGIQGSGRKGGQAAPEAFQWPDEPMNRFLNGLMARSKEQ
jgi:hypothetical protein